MRKFTFVCFGTLIAGFAIPTFACDGVVRSKPVVSANSVSLIVQSTQFVPVDDRLKQGIEKTKQHVCYCQSDVSEASRQLDSIVKKRDSIVSTQAKDFDSMKLLRDIFVHADQLDQVLSFLLIGVKNGLFFFGHGSLLAVAKLEDVGHFRR